MNYFIGWDVGGWNCEFNPNSRDALVILDQDQNLVGTPWRGNLRKTINASSSSEEFILSLFELCGLTLDIQSAEKVVLSIDTPLGFSQSLLDLLIHKQFIDQVEDSASNAYLYRYTERFLFGYGLKPLSPIKDMIGSQATKGMHALAKFAPKIIKPGVWSDENKLLAIEAYPSACKSSEIIKELLKPFVIAVTHKTELDVCENHYADELNQSDKLDALVCALVGWLNFNKPELVVQPDGYFRQEEGWIFVPVDGLTESYNLLVNDN